MNFSTFQRSSLTLLIYNSSYRKTIFILLMVKENFIYTKLKKNSKIVLLLWKEQSVSSKRKVSANFLFLFNLFCFKSFEEGILLS